MNQNRTSKIKGKTITYRGQKIAKPKRRWRNTANWWNPIYLSWLDKAHQAISDGYSEAISYYEAQRQMFIERMKKQGNVDALMDDALTQINAQINNSISVNAQDEANKLLEQVKNEFENAVLGSLQGNTKAIENLNKKLSEYQNSTKIKKENLYQNMKKYIENYLTQIYSKTSYQDVARHIASQIGMGQNDLSAIYNIGGYMRQLILSQIAAQDFTVNVDHFATALKGYIREEAMADALTKVFSQYGLVGMQTGSMTSSKGTQMKVDVILGSSGLNNFVQGCNIQKTGAGDKFLGSILDWMSDHEGTYQVVGVSDMTIELGVQSKSWIAPWDKIASSGKASPYIDFGNASWLLPQGDDKHYWHAGVASIMDNLTAAIGYQNVLFSTGNQLYWTGQMLTKFKNKGYVLAFHYSTRDERLSDSGAMSMQLHTV